MLPPAGCLLCLKCCCPHRQRRQGFKQGEPGLDREREGVLSAPGACGGTGAARGGTEENGRALIYEHYRQAR